MEPPSIPISSLPMNRRVFLRRSLAGLGLWHKNIFAQHMPEEPQARIPLIIAPSSLTPFVDRLPIPRIATPVGTASSPGDASVHLPLYRIEMQEREVQVHRDIKPTRIWSYGASFPGPTFETRSGQGLLVDWKNSLPAKHFYPSITAFMGQRLTSPRCAQ